jgi:DICT domain-containing protein
MTLSTTISLFRSIAHQFQDLRAVKTVAAMRTISNHIEDQVINRGLQVDFYAGFQRFSRFPAQLARYGRLGATCRRVYVFGVPDVTPPAIPGIEYVPLDPNSPLAEEWFLVVDTPQFWTTLLTQELPGHDTAGGGRRYDGLWSYDAQVVERASLLISQAMGSAYQPVRQRDYASQSVHVAEIATRMIGQLDAARQRSHRRTAQATTLTRAIELVSGSAPEQAAEGLATLLAQVFGAHEVTVALTRNGMTSVIASGGTATSRGRTLMPNDGPSGRALSSGAVQLVNDLRQARERDPLLISAQSMIAVPISGANGITGVISVGNDQAAAFNDDDAQALTAIGRLLGGTGETQGSAATQMNNAQLARLEQVLGKLRWPISRMAELHNRFELAGPLTQAQRETLTEFNMLVQSLNRALNNTRPELSA